jgi:hypothetical protein
MKGACYGSTYEGACHASDRCGPGHSPKKMEADENALFNAAAPCRAFGGVSLCPDVRRIDRI